MASTSATVDIEDSIRRAVNSQRAQHNYRDPAHGTMMLKQLHGEFKSLLARKDADPMLQAIAINDAMPRIRSIVQHLDQWSAAVVNMRPDQVPENGANRCL